MVQQQLFYRRTNLPILSLVCVIVLMLTGCNKTDNVAFIVTITAPAENTHRVQSPSISTSNPIQFEAFARDNNNNQLSGNNLVWTWTNNQTGEVQELGYGTGKGDDPVIEAQFSAGIHSIRLTATSTTGETKTAEKTLFIDLNALSALAQ